MEAQKPRPLAASTMHSRNLYIFDKLFKVNTYGTEGQKRILITDKTNTTMPLIAYDIGDLTSGIDEDKSGVYLKNVIGRVSEMIENRQGEMLTSHFIHIIFRDIESINRYRVYWISRGQVRLEIETESKDLSLSLQNRIKEKFNQNGFDIDSLCFKKIGLLDGLKHRTVVKEVK